jgi:hypothetical protein
MSVIAKVDLKANGAVNAGAEISLYDLFSYSERNKEFTLESDVEREKTKLKITVAKLGSIEIMANTSKKKGGKTSFVMISKTGDIRKKVKAKETIKKDDVLSVTVETV